MDIVHIQFINAIMRQNVCDPDFYIITHFDVQYVCYISKLLTYVDLIDNCYNLCLNTQRFSICMFDIDLVEKLGGIFKQLYEYAIYRKMEDKIRLVGHDLAIVPIDDANGKGPMDDCV